MSQRNCYGCPNFRTNIEIRDLRRAYPDDENNPFPLDVEWKNCLQGPDHWLNCKRRKQPYKEHTLCGYSNCFRPFYKKRGFMPCCKFHYDHPKKWPIGEDGIPIFTGSIFRKIVVQKLNDKEKTP